MSRPYKTYTPEELTVWIRKLVSDNDIHANQYASTEKWLISRDVLNCKPSFDTPPRDQVKSVYQ